MTPEAHALPAILAEIAEVAGLEAALAVAAARGGARVYIPRRPGPGHWLTRAVGQRAANAIAAHLTAAQTGTHIDLPVGPHGSYLRQRRARRQQIEALIEEGLSADRIANEVGITRRAVFRALARRREREDDPQGRLL